MKCSVCSTNIPSNVRYCPNCAEDTREGASSSNQIDEKLINIAENISSLRTVAKRDNIERLRKFFTKLLVFGIIIFLSYAGFYLWKTGVFEKPTLEFVWEEIVPVKTDSLWRGDYSDVGNVVEGIKLEVSGTEEVMLGEISEFSFIILRSDQLTLSSKDKANKFLKHDIYLSDDLYLADLGNFIAGSSNINVTKKLISSAEGKETNILENEHWRSFNGSEVKGGFVFGGFSKDEISRFTGMDLISDESISLIEYKDGEISGITNTLNSDVSFIGTSNKVSTDLLKVSPDSSEIVSMIVGGDFNKWWRNFYIEAGLSGVLGELEKTTGVVWNLEVVPMGEGAFNMFLAKPRAGIGSSTFNIVLEPKNIKKGKSSLSLLRDRLELYFGGDASGVLRFEEVFVGTGSVVGLKGVKESSKFSEEVYKGVNTFGKNINNFEYGEGFFAGSDDNRIYISSSENGLKNLIDYSLMDGRVTPNSFIEQVDENLVDGNLSGLLYVVKSEIKELGGDWAIVSNDFPESLIGGIESFGNKKIWNFKWQK